MTTHWHHTSLTWRRLRSWWKDQIAPGLDGNHQQVCYHSHNLCNGHWRSVSICSLSIFCMCESQLTHYRCWSHRSLLYTLSHHSSLTDEVRLTKAKESSSMSMYELGCFCMRNAREEREERNWKKKRGKAQEEERNKSGRGKEEERKRKWSENNDRKKKEKRGKGKAKERGRSENQKILCKLT